MQVASQLIQVASGALFENGLTDGADIHLRQIHRSVLHSAGHLNGLFFDFRHHVLRNAALHLVQVVRLCNSFGEVRPCIFELGVVFGRNVPLGWKRATGKLCEISICRMVTKSFSTSGIGTGGLVTGLRGMSVKAAYPRLAKFLYTFTMPRERASSIVTPAEPRTFCALP